jgi:small-conductance mechanosensitive channel
MNIVTSFLNSINWGTVIGNAVRILIIFAIGWAVIGILKKVLHHLENRLLRQGEAAGEPASESAKRVDTLMRLVRQGVYLVVWITVGMVILKEIGVDIAPILASAGILGLAVGFGAQNLVRDVISGFFFILENQVRVGDVAVVNGTGGLVEKLNFRTIVLRDQAGTVHVFPNGTVTTLSNLTKEWSAYVFEVGVAYKEDTDKVTEIIRSVCDGMRKDETYGSLIIEEPEIFGVDQLGDSAVVIKGRIKTRPIRQWMVGREFLRRVKYAFDEQGIEIPFPHQSLYFGEASKPLAVQMLERTEPSDPDDSVRPG